MTTRSSVPRLAAVLVALVMAVAAVPAASAAPKHRIEVRPAMVQLLRALRHQYSAPGAGFTFGDGTREATLSTGTRELGANEPIGSTDEVRVGSNTKMFVASVVLQLVHERRLDLDARVERYLPGVVRYPADKVPGDPAAYDGRAVTLRQLLQHQSGIPDYADYPYILNPVHQYSPPADRDNVAHALPNGPAFRPGAAWAYSNTNYALAGMVVERVTGRSLAREMADRIIRPLHLRRTFFAQRGQRYLSGEHVHGYLTELVPLDITEFEPGIFGAAGALVSTPDDMNTFLSALLAGRVVPPAELAEMQDDVPYLTGGYGLGLVRIPLSCGQAWGHAGQVAGYQTLALAIPHGRSAFLTMNSTLPVTLLPPTVPASAYDLLEQALC